MNSIKDKFKIIVDNEVRELEKMLKVQCDETTKKYFVGSHIAAKLIGFTVITTGNIASLKAFLDSQIELLYDLDSTKEYENIHEGCITEFKKLRKKLEKLLLKNEVEKEPEYLDYQRELFEKLKLENVSRAIIKSVKEVSDSIVIVEFESPDANFGQHFYTPYIDGKAADVQADTFDQALLAALCCKYDGHNTTMAPRYIAKMIGMEAF